MTVGGRPDLGTFEDGAMYRHNDTDELVEFIGTALMPELAGELVGVFKFTRDAGCIIATQRSFDQGETFTPAGDALADELDLGE